MVKLRVLLFSLACVVFTARAAAIVIRDDIPDAAYLARESDFPAVFPLFHTKEGFPDCMATVIADRWAVTAAHCAKVKSLTTAIGPAGAGHGVVIAGRRATIDRVALHPGTGSGRAPDVALLHLVQPVTFVAPVPLYRAQDEVGQIVVIPGGGGTGNGRTGIGREDGKFRVAENRVDFIENGKLWWRFDAPGPNSRALTLEGISGPGDSGGPALVRTPFGWSIVGISSAQDTKDGPEGLYGVDEAFVRVSEVAGWIDREIGRAGSRHLSGARPAGHVAGA